MPVDHPPNVSTASPGVITDDSRSECAATRVEAATCGRCGRVEGEGGCLVLTAARRHVSALRAAAERGDLRFLATEFHYATRDCLRAELERWKTKCSHAEARADRAERGRGDLERALAAEAMVAERDELLAVAGKENAKLRACVADLRKLLTGVKRVRLTLKDSL